MNQHISSDILGKTNVFHITGSFTTHVTSYVNTKPLKQSHLISESMLVVGWQKYVVNIMVVSCLSWLTIVKVIEIYKYCI